MPPEQTARSNIDEYGWHFVYVYGENGEPPFGYTIGLTETFSQPELIVMGLGKEMVHEILSETIRLIECGEGLVHLKELDGVLEGLPVKFVKFPASLRGEYFDVAKRTLNSDFETLQLCWPNNEGTFPGFGCEVPPNQPVPWLAMQ